MTIPNVISFARILAVPYFVWLLLGQEATARAGVVLVIIGGTDWLDGFLARRLGQVSKLGKALDPVADRLAIVAAVLAGWAADILPGWLVGGLLIREMFMAAMAAWLLVKYRQTIAVRPLGKLATLLLYGSIPAYYLAAAEVAPTFFSGFGLVCGVLGLGFYWAVVFAYVPDVRQAAANSLSSETTNDGGVI